MTTLLDQSSAKIHSFTDLIAWKEAHKLVIIIYQITKDFPREEVFELTRQLRKAAVSITSNLAEGFSRKSFAEKLQFYSTSLGSLTEIQNQLLIARDVGFLKKDSFQTAANQSIYVSKLMNGLIKKTKTLIPNS